MQEILAVTPIIYQGKCYNVGFFFILEIPTGIFLSFESRIHVSIEHNSLIYQVGRKLVTG